MNARSDSELKELAPKLLPFLTGRRQTLTKLLADSSAGTIIVSEKTKAFWQVKKIATDKFAQVFEQAEKSEADLSEDACKQRADYLASAQAAWAGLKNCFTALQKEVIGPYALGECWAAGGGWESARAG